MPVAWDEFVPVQDKPKDKSFDWSEFSPIDVTAAAVPGVPSQAQQEQIRRLPRPEELTTYGGPPKPLASLAETIAEPVEMAFEPKVTVPRLPIKEGESKLLTVGKEAVNILAGIPEFISSPAGVVSSVVAPAAPLTVGTVFTAAMLKDLASQVQQSYKDWDKMSDTQKTKAVVDMVGTGTFAGLPWLKPAVRALRSKTTPTPEVSDASKIGEAEKVYGDVRPQPEQGVREVPVQESGAGVQPQAPQAEVLLKPTVTETTPPVPASEMPKTPSETGLYPAVREVGGKVDVAEAGTTHPQIIKEEGLKAEDIDQRGFVQQDPVTGEGKFKDREQAAAQSGVPTQREPGRQHSTDLPEAQETFAQREARLFHESQLRQSVPAAELPKPTTKLPDLVKKLGRNEVNALLGEWEDGAELSADGKYIKSWSDPRNPTSKSRVPATEFLSWYEQKAKAPTPSEEGSFEPEPEIRGMGGAVPSEFDQPHSIVSNMFAAIDRDRAAMGKPPMELGRRRSWDEDNARALSRMNHDPAWIPDLIREVLAKPRPLLSWENAGLVWHRAKLTAELNNSLQRIAQAFDGGVKETLAESKLDAARFEDELEMLDRAVGRGGTGSEAGRSLQAQKMGAGDDFTLVEMRLRKRAAVGGRPLTDAESAEIKSLHDQLNAQKAEYEKSLADKDKRIAEQEVKLALDRIALESKQQPDVPPHVRLIADKVKTYFDTRAEAALKRLSGKLFTLSPQVLADLTDLGVSRILSGAIEFGEWSVKMAEAVGERVKPHLKTVWDSAQSALNKHIEQIAGPKPVAERVKRVVSGREAKDNREKIIKGIAEKVSAGKRGEITVLVQKLARYFVQEGVTERNALIDAVHNELTAIDPEFTRRQTMDAISGYGDFKQLRKDEISKQLRDLKGQMQQVAKLEDMQASQPPLKTGVERRIPSKEESRLIKLVNEAKRQFQVPISDPSTQLRSSLDELKKRMATRIDELNEKMRVGDFSRRPRLEIVLDPEAQQLKVQYERTKLKFERMITQDRLRQRSWPEKAMDTFVKWRRGFVLSSPITLGKLTTAAAQRLSFTPLEEAVGAGIGRIIPDIAEKAPREGGWNTRAEAAALSGGFTKGMKDAWDTLRTGQSDLDVLHGGRFDPAVGESLVLDKSVVDYIGQSHGMLKAPVKRAEFERSLRKRIDFAIRTGQDMTDPLVMMRAATEAYKDGNRAIFLQDNAVVSAYKRALSAFEQRSKETGKVPLERKAVAATARVLLPIVKVPTNIVAETLTYSTGLFTGGARLGRALYKGVESLKPEEADLIMRQLKKGSIGGAMLITGYLLPEYIGGYYQHGVKRDKRDVKPGAIRVGNVNLPYWMLHNPLLNTLQLGATIRRVADSKLSKKDREAQGLTAGVVAGGLGLTEETPFVREMLELTKAWNPHDRSAFFGELAKGIAVPQALQWAAKTYDVDSQGNIIERKPKTALEHIKMGVPGLREQVKPKP